MCRNRHLKLQTCTSDAQALPLAFEYGNADLLDFQASGHSMKPLGDLFAGGDVHILDALESNSLQTIFG
jgi:hypothetical protein